MYYPPIQSIIKFVGLILVSMIGLAEKFTFKLSFKRINLFQKGIKRDIIIFFQEIGYTDALEV